MTGRPAPAATTAQPERRVRLFDGGGFLRTISAAQAAALVAASLAEWRGNTLRFTAPQVQVRRGLDGLKVHNHETFENPRGCYSYPTKTLLEVVL